ncbi:hypothetical protein V6N13_002119 [Hibiscus sabdariffa]|uniref:Uncharacterized protein n=1 Tax=Hibiscus sabdariffa TaxID=183260 RepID=A0ABR2C1W3_9ROSI
MLIEHGFMDVFVVLGVLQCLWQNYGRFDALSGCSLVDVILLILARPWSVCIRHIPHTQNLILHKVVALCRGSFSVAFDYVSAVLTELVHNDAYDN